MTCTSICTLRPSSVRAHGICSVGLVQALEAGGEPGAGAGYAEGEAKILGAGVQGAEPEAGEILGLRQGEKCGEEKPGDDAGVHCACGTRFSTFLSRHVLRATTSVDISVDAAR